MPCHSHSHRLNRQVAGRHTATLKNKRKEKLLLINLKVIPLQYLPIQMKLLTMMVSCCHVYHRSIISICCFPQKENEKWEKIMKIQLNSKEMFVDIILCWNYIVYIFSYDCSDEDDTLLQHISPSWEQKGKLKTEEDLLQQLKKTHNFHSLNYL